MDALRSEAGVLAAEPVARRRGILNPSVTDWQREYLR